MINKIHQGDVIEVLKSWPESFVDCCVTSPPYWGLRDYGVEGQLGLEKTPEEFIAKMTDVFREVRRVLKPEGTCWVNMGDSYYNYRPWNNGYEPKQKIGSAPIFSNVTKRSTKIDNSKEKDLCGIPWMLAFALRADGWYLRQDIIWHKPNPMPESVTDRCTKSHEYLFLLSKAGKYYYDGEAVKEETKSNSLFHGSSTFKSGANGDRNDGGRCQVGEDNGNRNRRSVWTIATHSFPDAHFATFPPKLVEPCILAGTSEKGYCPECGKAWVRVVESKTINKDGWGIATKNHHEKIGCSSSILRNNQGRAGDVITTTTGWASTCACWSGPIPGLVLDPFMGSGTTALVAYEHGRNFVGIELNPSYIEMANKRISKAQAQLRMF